METSPLICIADQWIGFYMEGPPVMKELKRIILVFFINVLRKDPNENKSNCFLSLSISYVCFILEGNIQGLKIKSSHWTIIANLHLLSNITSKNTVNLGKR